MTEILTNGIDDDLTHHEAVLQVNIDEQTVR